MQFAGSGADEGKLLGWFLWGDNLKLVAVLLRCPKRLHWWMKKALPGLRPVGEPEERAIVPVLQTVAPRVLAVGPAGGQIRDACDLVIDDRAIANGRPEHLVSARIEGADERL